jgi:4-hydroxybutyrate CoA-transferase
MAALDLSVDPKAEVAKKRMSAEEAAARIRSGDLIWIPSAHAPPSILAALVGRESELSRVKIRSVMIPNLGWFRKDALEHWDLQVQVPILPDNQTALAAGIIDYHPYSLMMQHKAADAGREEGQAIDVLMLVVSPPNERGWACVGHACWDAVSSVKRARQVFVETSPNVPRTCGDTWIHVSQLDAIVEGDRPALAGPDPDPAKFPEVDRRIAANVKSLVRDGDTIQIGLGKHTGALPLLGAFDDANDLGYFGELTVAGTVGLARKGIITSRYAEVHPNRFVACHIGNSPEDLATIENNPFYELHSYEHTNDPRVISRHDHLLAINGVLCVDLSGQIGVYAVGDRMYSGLGGHLAFALGAYLSPHGRYVSVLRSTAAGGSVSTIVPQFPKGQIVSIPREIADTIITDQGVARLLGRSVRERTEEIINIAHPDHRDWLREEAKRLYWP